jgi:uncharacterized alpha-E superfamily protein
MPRGLVIFQIGKHIERCLQTISMTQSYYRHNYNLDGKDLLYWRKVIAIPSGYEFYQKAIVTLLTIIR